MIIGEIKIKIIATALKNTQNKIKLLILWKTMIIMTMKIMISIIYNIIN